MPAGPAGILHEELLFGKGKEEGSALLILEVLRGETRCRVKGMSKSKWK